MRLIATVHGEWVRIHPFANGNGRDRSGVGGVAGGVPVFVTVRPRPHDSAYAAASRASMGRPPDSTGDHTLAVRVIAHRLTLALLPPD